MKEHIVDNLIVFMQRVQLSAAEIPAYLEALTALQELKPAVEANSGEKSDDNG